MMDNLFKHSLPIQLRFNDADTLGHINNAVYLNFYDLGKTSYFQTICGETVLPSDIDVVVAHLDVDFLSPIFLTDTVEVQTMVEKIGTKSFTLLQRIVCSDTNEVKCVCRTVMVGFDFKTNSSKPISDKWRTAIVRFEGRNDLK
ncbi:MAG: acyl-CoA thioesterase [Paludibacteraceae bacterium]